MPSLKRTTLTGEVLVALLADLDSLEGEGDFDLMGTLVVAPTEVSFLAAATVSLPLVGGAFLAWALAALWASCIALLSALVKAGFFYKRIKQDIH